MGETTGKDGSMGITDELRAVAAKTECANGRCEKLYRGDLDHIADRIDAEHESACAEAYGNGVMSVPIALDESAWVKLPVDADGVPIHIGDVMSGYGWPNGGVYCRAIVNEVTILVGPQDGAYRGWLMWATNECRHYHAPTVEDVLREFASDIADVLGGDDFRLDDSDELFAEYAAKLRLAGDGE